MTCTLLLPQYYSKVGQGRVQWGALVKTVMNLAVLRRAGNVLTRIATVRFWGEYLSMECGNYLRVWGSIQWLGMARDRKGEGGFVSNATQNCTCLTERSRLRIKEDSTCPAMWQCVKFDSFQNLQALFLMRHLVPDYQLLSYCDWKEQLANLFQDGFMSSLTAPTDLSCQELQPRLPIRAAAMNVLLVFCDVWC
jgi:hypothetical protein